MSTYNTNLAAEFHVLSVLHRLGMSATLTLGNKKSVDIVIARDAGDTYTVDVKGLAGKTNWPVDNLKEGKKRHFIAFVTFLGKISDPSESPEVYIVPSEEVSSVIYQNPAAHERFGESSRTLGSCFDEEKAEPAAWSGGGMARSVCIRMSPAPRRSGRALVASLIRQ